MRLRKLFTSLPLSPPLYKFAFAMLLVGLAFALTYTEAADTFSTYDVKAILVLGTAVNVPLLVGSLFLLRRSTLKLIRERHFVAGRPSQRRDGVHHSHRPLR